MTGPSSLDEHDVHVLTLAIPIDVSLMGELCIAVDEIVQRHGLQPSVLLLDGTYRIVARRVGAPERAS